MATYGDPPPYWGNRTICDPNPFGKAWGWHQPTVDYFELHKQIVELRAQFAELVRLLAEERK